MTWRPKGESGTGDLGEQLLELAERLLLKTDPGLADVEQRVGLRVGGVVGERHTRAHERNRRVH